MLDSIHWKSCADVATTETADQASKRAIISDQTQLTIQPSRGGRAMDSLINAAGRALSAGDPLGALNYVALREDPPALALALRAIAMAQIGDLSRAKALLQRAIKAFGSNEPLSRARCVVAEAEVALAARIAFIAVAATVDG
jgi:hypothetical protein